MAEYTAEESGLVMAALLAGVQIGGITDPDTGRVRRWAKLPGGLTVDITSATPRDAVAEHAAAARALGLQPATLPGMVPPEVAAAAAKALNDMADNHERSAQSWATHQETPTGMGVMVQDAELKRAKCLRALAAALQGQAALPRWSVEEIDGVIMAELIDEHGYDIPRAGAVALGVMQRLRGQAAPAEAGICRVCEGQGRYDDPFEPKQLQCTGCGGTGQPGLQDEAEAAGMETPAEGAGLRPAPRWKGGWRWNAR